MTRWSRGSEQARAVVELALYDVRAGQETTLQRDAARWLWSESRSSPYAFVNLADYLGIDAHRLRNSLAMRGVRDRRSAEGRT